MPNPSRKVKHKLDAPVIIPAVVENVVGLVEIKITAAVGNPARLHVRWEVGDDSGGEYVPIRQGSETFEDAPGEGPDDPSALDAYLHVNAASQETVLENLHKVIFNLLEDRELIGVGVLEE